MLLTIAALLLGLLLLIKGADWLVKGAASLAKRLGVPALVIGLTVVAFGTSLPELVVNLLAAWRNAPDIAIGNILGSSTANILLIGGLAAIVYPLAVKRSTVWREIPFSLLAIVLVGLMAIDSVIDHYPFNELGRIDGLALLSLFIVFLYYIYGLSQEGADGDSSVQTYPFWKTAGYVVAGLLVLIAGGRLLVDAAVAIATALGVSQSLIALTVVAVGTSLPELATSVVAAYRHHPEIAVGNIVGSNIFNIFWVLGLTATLRPLPFAPAARVDVLMTMAATLLLFLAMFIGKRHILERWQGWSFLALYVAYVSFLIVRG